MLVEVVQFSREAYPNHRIWDHHPHVWIQRYSTSIWVISRIQVHGITDGIMYGNYKDPGKRSGVDLIFGPGGLEIAETNRRDVRDKLVGPLTAAMRD